MINQLLGKVFGTKNERVIKALKPNVQAINALEPQIQKLTDEQLRAKTDEFRQRIQERLSRVGKKSRSPEAERARTQTMRPIWISRSGWKSKSTTRCRKSLTKSWWKRLPWFARPDVAYSTCAISTCS